MRRPRALFVTALLIGMIGSPGPAPADRLYTLLTAPDYPNLPLSPQDTPWQWDPSALAVAPAWDVNAGYSSYQWTTDAGGGLSDEGSEFHASVAKGLGDQGGVGLHVGGARWTSAAAEAGQGSRDALGAAYGWAMGLGFSAGCSLWLANGDIPNHGQDDKLVGLGLRWQWDGQLIAVSGLWTKDALARPAYAAIGGPWGQRGAYGAQLYFDQNGYQDSMLMLGYAGLRVLAHDGHPGLGWDFAHPDWDVLAFLDRVPAPEQVAARLSLNWHGWQLAAAPGTRSTGISAGWRSWSAPPRAEAEAEAEAEPAEEGPPAEPDVDPHPAPPPAESAAPRPAAP